MVISYNTPSDYVVLRTSHTNDFDEHINNLIVSFIPYRLYADLSLDSSHILLLILARPRMASRILDAHAVNMKHADGIHVTKMIRKMIEAKTIMPVDFLMNTDNGMWYIDYIKRISTEVATLLASNNMITSQMTMYMFGFTAECKGAFLCAIPLDKLHIFEGDMTHNAYSRRDMYLSALTAMSSGKITQNVIAVYHARGDDGKHECPGFRRMVKEHIVDNRDVDAAVALCDETLLKRLEVPGISVGVFTPLDGYVPWEELE